MAGMWPTVGRVAGQAVAIGLAIEALRSVFWIARILSVVAIYDAVVLGLVAVRAGVTALQGAAVGRLWQGTTAGRRLGELGLVSSAALLVFEIGLSLSPSSVFPDFRWYVVGGYAAYAALAVLVLRSTEPDR
jgi:hypothetical protein